MRTNKNAIFFIVPSRKENNNIKIHKYLFVINNNTSKPKGGRTKTLYEKQITVSVASKFKI